MNVLEINVLALAYLGDAIYELYIRKELLKRHSLVNDMQKEALKYVSAKGQANFLEKMIDENFLNEEEISVIKRARNNKAGTRPKNCDPMTYKKATGLEALIAHLYLSKKENRIGEIMSYILEEEC